MFMSTSSFPCQKFYDKYWKFKYDESSRFFWRLLRVLCLCSLYPGSPDPLPQYWLKLSSSTLAASPCCSGWPSRCQPWCRPWTQNIIWTKTKLFTDLVVALGPTLQVLLNKTNGCHSGHCQLLNSNWICQQDHLKRNKGSYVPSYF